ncbi:MAG: hypothetical protein M3R61_02480 [Chloroflexota bacterium]|nr:hypothetical protein [Chloroflexota bacterium]
MAQAGTSRYCSAPAQVQAQVEQQVRSSYPDATNVTVPTPNLLYMADEAGSPQKAIKPDLNFATSLSSWVFVRLRGS